MLKPLKYIDMQGKLNLYNLGTNFISLFASFTIQQEQGFKGVPGRGWFGKGLCSIGIHIGNTEFKIGPSLGRQWGRYEKRYIDNEATNLKEVTPANEDKEAINRVKEICIEQVDKDTAQMPKNYGLAVALGIVSMAIKYQYGGFCF